MTSGANDLAGRVALVTGSATGIGRSVAEALASRGAAVVAHGLDPALNADVLADWTRRGWRAIASDTDLSTQPGALALIDEVERGLGMPDILVLNASVELPETLPELSVQAMTAQMAVNLVSSSLLLQALVPKMAAQSWGRVVAMGSVQEERPNARHLFYAGTKAALTNMVLNLARNQRSPDITFNVVRPGAIATDRNRVLLTDPVFAQAVVDRIPLNRVGSPSDCSGIVAFLCSAEGAYINGSVIAIDGGMRL